MKTVEKLIEEKVKELETKWGTIYHQEPEGFGIQINMHLESFLKQALKEVADAAYNDGYNDAY